VASESRIEWQTDAWAAFDEIENAHRAVGGVKPGRRFLTQQLNYAYTTLLAESLRGSWRQFLLSGLSRSRLLVFDGRLPVAAAV
jgi:hypothetical protein